MQCVDLGGRRIIKKLGAAVRGRRLLSGTETVHGAFFKQKTAYEM